MRDSACSDELELKSTMSPTTAAGGRKECDALGRLDATIVTE